MIITTIGLNIPESKCLCLGKLIVFQLIKNEMSFLPLQQIYEERFAEKYSK
jgi:hypothetical protein